MERLYFLATVHRGLADAEAGRLVSHEDVKARFGLNVVPAKDFAVGRESDGEGAWPPQPPCCSARSLSRRS